MDFLELSPPLGISPSSPGKTWRWLVGRRSGFRECLCGIFSLWLHSRNFSCVHDILINFEGFEKWCLLFSNVFNFLIKEIAFQWAEWADASVFHRQPYKHRYVTERSLRSAQNKQQPARGGPNLSTRLGTRGPHAFWDGLPLPSFFTDNHPMSFLFQLSFR